MKKFIIVIAALIFSTSMVLAFGFKPKATPSQDGCCAGHKGVCGCQGQRAMCCDGSVDAVCACLKLKEGGEKILPSKAYENEE